MQTEIAGSGPYPVSLCVDSYDQGVLAGRLGWGLMERKEVSFHSLTQLLVTLDQIMTDERGFPQSFTGKRYFVPAPPRSPAVFSGTEVSHGKLATFHIRVMYRQHASWQGNVRWMEGAEEQNFRSVLELILLLDNALSVRASSVEAAADRARRAGAFRGGRAAVRPPLAAV